MGKRIISQRRGRGAPVYRVPSHRFKTNAKYENFKDTVKGKVINLIDDPSKTGIIMVIEWENNSKSKYLAPEGIGIGDEILQGPDAGISIGNVLPLKAIPEGIPIFNIESRAGDGGKMIRSSGTAGYIISKDEKTAIVKLPSKRTKQFSINSLATIGVVSGGGRPDKPLVTAGKSYYKHKAKNKRWPKVRGVAMNPVNHPFGGKEHHSGKSTTIKRTAPPGRKVGHIAAKRTGRRKR